MTRLSIILAALALLGVMSAPALAQTANKTWVSSASGNDTGTCQFVAPCKTFAYAITQTAAGGELDVKDSGSYGVVTITKAISIVGAGALAAIAVPSGGTGITVNAGPSDKVVLQGLVIDGHGVGQYGILYNSGVNLIVDQCQIRNVSTEGIKIHSNATGSVFHIVDTVISNGATGVLSQYIDGSLLRVAVYDGGQGITVGAGKVIIIDSAFGNNTQGVVASDGGTITIGQTTIYDNQYGVYTFAGGAVVSYANNNFSANGTDIDTSAGGSFGTIKQQ